MKKLGLTIVFALIVCLTSIANPEFNSIWGGWTNDLNWKVISDISYAVECGQDVGGLYQYAVARLLDVGDPKYLKAFGAVWYKGVEPYPDPTAFSISDAGENKWIVSCLLCNAEVGKSAPVEFQTEGDGKVVCYPLLSIITNSCPNCVKTSTGK